MGHQLIGPIPQTRRWDQVVNFLEHQGTAAQIAAATVNMAAEALIPMYQDRGVCATSYLLHQLPHFARAEDHSRVASDLGLYWPEDDQLHEVVDLLVAFTGAVDRTLGQNRGRTDLGEMCQLAAVEALARHFVNDLRPLLPGTALPVRVLLAQLHNPNRFADFARRFFARLTFRILDYYLSRVLAAHVGPHRRFLSLGDVRAFLLAVEAHCYEMAVVVRKYTADWIGSRRRDEITIDLDQAGRYACGGMFKILEYFQRENPSHAA